MLTKQLHHPRGPTSRDGAHEAARPAPFGATEVEHRVLSAQFVSHHQWRRSAEEVQALGLASETMHAPHAATLLPSLQLTSTPLPCVLNIGQK